MLLIVFGLLLALTLIFLFVGVSMDAPYFKIGGATFMFVLGLVLLFGTVTVQSGLVEATTYTYDLGNVSLTNTTTSFVYSDISRDLVNGLDVMHLFGFLLSVIGVFTFMYSFFEIRTPREIDGNGY